MSKRCFCNVEMDHKCCVLDCRAPRTKPEGCYPCGCYQYLDTCLHTDETRFDRERRGE